jgi:hypothetical protein
VARRGPSGPDRAVWRVLRGAPAAGGGGLAQGWADRAHLEAVAGGLRVPAARSGPVHGARPLRRRGVIRRATVQAPSDPLDEPTRRELDEACDQLGVESGRP